nr:immunoglobulin light chain junction region [Macaca mulatta]
CQQGYDTPFTF